VSAPVTPCAPEAAVSFVERRFGEAVAKTIDPASRAGGARQRRITELRRSGELRYAERYGWLSLAAWLLDMPVRAVRDIDPGSNAFMHRAGGTDVLADPIGVDPAPALTTVADTGLEVSDPRDPLGFTVCEMLGVALSAGIVDVEGHSVGGGAVAASLRARLETVSNG